MSEADTTRQFQHDCEDCTFLGGCAVFVVVKDRSVSFDLYHCAKNPDMPTVIARYGSDGADYISGLQLAYYGEGVFSALMEALARARQRGLAIGSP